MKIQVHTKRTTNITPNISIRTGYSSIEEVPGSYLKKGWGPYPVSRLITVPSSRRYVSRNL